jgi:P4 family phage/plasmid primase-like protien
MVTNDDNISVDKINQWADFWHYKRGINIFPLDKDKTTYEHWSQYKTEAITDEIHEEWKRKGRYANGMILMPGKVMRGEKKGSYFVGIDFDKQLGFKEFCNIFGSNTSIDELKQNFIVEQHEADPNSLHLYFYSEIPFIDKSSDDILGIEIKSNSKGLMCATPSYHSETDSRWQIKGTNSPITLKSEEATKLMSNIDDICRKYRQSYLKNGKDGTSSVNLTPLIKQMINSLEINPDIIIKEGARHDTLISLANSLLIKHKYNININREELKKFFLEVNEKLCSPTPLPENEVETIWRDAVKFSENRIAEMQILNNDKDDTLNYKTIIVLPLEIGDKLLEQEIVQNFVYDIQTNSIDCILNTKYDLTRIIVPINIKQWNDVRKNFRKLCEEKGIKENDISLLLECIDNNFDLIKKHYLQNNRKHTTVLAAAQERKKQRLELIKDATDFVMSKYRFLTIEESKDILFYDSSKGVYAYSGEILIEKEIEKKYGYKLKTSDINEIKDYVTRKTYIKKEKFDSNIDIINIENGLLNCKTGEFSQHTPDFLSLNQKPIKYNPEAKAPRFEKFLNEVLYPEDIRTAKEIIAYTFIRKNIFQYWFVLIGNGGNGKNVFVGIVSSLHGSKNISNVPLTHLANPNHRFALSRLENKDINIDTELSSKSYNDLSTLKKLTDTQPITVEKKGKDLYDVELWAKLFLSCNELPISSDNSDARYRREIILPFPHQFEEEQKDDPKIKVADPFLLNKIINDEEEMSGILNIVIDSLKSIHENKKIHVNSTISQRRAKSELTADPVSAFLDMDGWVPSINQTEEYLTKDAFYEDFTTFCNDHKLHVLSYDAFAKKLKKEHNLSNGRKIEDDGNGNKKKITIWFVKRLTDEEKAAKKEDEEEV